MAYDVSSRGYLGRARHRLDEALPEALFYAAFELRCGVETRLQEYLEPHVEKLNLRKDGWRIPAMGKTLGRDFASGEKIARLRVLTEDRSRVFGTWYHTPVTPSLRTKAEQLGNYLHATIPQRPSDDPWWRITRAVLESVYAELWLATRGRLLSMPLVDLATGELIVSLETDGGMSGKGLKSLMMTEARQVLDISYLEVAPESLFNGG